MPHQFDFIDEHFFRTCMQADYAEMEKSLDVNAWKSALVISGSIVEALIIDSLIAANPNETTKMLNLGLGAAIGAALQAKIITKRTADLASVVQDYRNLIHPGRSVRTKERPNQEEAKIARALVDIIIREVSDQRGKTQGMTSAQLINKIEIDSTASKLVKHYTKGMKDKEVRAFLLSDLPRRYFEIDATIADLGESLSDESADESLRLSAVNSCLSEAYRDVLMQVSNDVKSQVAQAYAQIMRDGTQEYIMKFTEQFFSAEYIEFLDGDNRELIKDYLLEVTGKFEACDYCKSSKGSRRTFLNTKSESS
jgi:uncharacterized glyoxalase superfamily protein PhnB